MLQSIEEVGFERGLEQGLEQGWDQCRSFTLREVAKGLLASGKLTEEEIARITGLIPEELRELTKPSES